MLEKHDVIDLWKTRHVIGGQHIGQQGTETAWMQHVRPDRESFLTPFGGKPETAIERLAALTGFQPKPLPEVPDEM